ncbi:MAG: tetratricopeptide repeat protein [Cytophagales bacterium]
MRNRYLPFIILFFSSFFAAFSQGSLPLLALKNNDIKTAKYLIDSLTEMQVYEKNAEVWYVNGLIYENIYFSGDSTIRKMAKSPLLIAAESYVKASIDIKNNKYATIATKRLDSAVTKNLLFEGEKLEKLKKIDDAVSHFEIYAKIRERDTTGLLKLAIAADKANNLELAEKTYLKLISLKYTTPFVYKSLFLILKQQKKYADAQNISNEAEKSFGKDEDWVRMDIALAIEMNKIDLAMSKLDSAALKFPENKHIYLFNIGAIYDSKDSSNLAIAYYEKALASNFNYFEPNYNIGGIYFQKASAIYAEINKMPYVEYQKNGKIKEEDGHQLSKVALHYFERCYEINKDEKVKLLLKDIYRNLKLTSKLKEIDK